MYLEQTRESPTRRVFDDWDDTLEYLGGAIALVEKLGDLSHVGNLSKMRNEESLPAFREGNSCHPVKERIPVIPYVNARVAI